MLLSGIIGSIRSARYFHGQLPSSQSCYFDEAMFDQKERVKNQHDWDEIMERKWKQYRHDFHHELLRIFQEFLKDKRKKKEVIKWFESVPAEYWEESSNNALHIAASQNDPDVLKYLLSAGYKDVNGKNSQEETPLTIAIVNGNKKVVKLLLSKGAAIDHTLYARNFGPLHLAAEQRKFEIVKTLLEVGADVNALDDDCRCPLHVLLNHGNAGKGKQLPVQMISELLVKAGADVNLLNSHGESSLYLMIKYGYFETAVTLLDSAAICTPEINEKSQTLLHIACEKTNIALAERLMDDESVDLNASDAFGMRPLHYAVQSGSYHITKRLINIAVDINALDIEGLSPLCHAIKKHDYELTKLLINSGASTSVLKCTPMFDPLLEVVRSRSYGLVRLLLEVEPELKTTDELECLEIVCEHVKIDILMKLLWHGIDTTTCEYFVIFGLLLYGNDYDFELDPVGKAKTLKRLLSKRSQLCLSPHKLKKALYTVVAHADEKEVRSFIERQLIRCDFATLLQYSVVFGDDNAILNVIGKLVRDGRIDINTKDKKGYTLLHLMASKGNNFALEYLLKLGAEVDCVVNKEETPLLLAIRLDYIGCVKLLLYYSADVRRADYWNHPIRYLTKNYNPKLKVWILSQLAVSQLLGKIVLKDTSDFFGSYEERIFSDCQQELERMKRFKINDRTTLQDVLIDPERYYRNQDVLRNLGKESLLKQYKQNRNYLERILEEMKERPRLLERAEVFLTRVFQIKPGRAYPIVFSNIFKHLSNRDLRYLALFVDD